MRILITALALCLVSFSAYAFSSGLNSTINERSDIGQFRSLINRTHVVENLPQGTYTVFAPNDGAMAKIDSTTYPCFYSDQCLTEQENIVRNHIVKGEINLGDVARGEGGVYAINKHRISVSEPTKGEFYVDGHKVISQNLTSGGMLYVIEGVVASPLELSELKTLKSPIVQTTTEKTIVETKNPDPDSNSVITTKTTTTIKDAQ